VVRVWPLSDYAPKAQYLVARCYEASGKEEKAFKTYQSLLEKQPKIEKFDLRSHNVMAAQACGACFQRDGGHRGAACARPAILAPGWPC